MFTELETTMSSYYEPDGPEERTAFYAECADRRWDEIERIEDSADDLNITPVYCIVHSHQYFNGFCLRCGSDAMLDVGAA